MLLVCSGSRVVLGLTLAGLGVGLIATIAGHPDLASLAFAATIVAALVPLTLSVIWALRHGRMGVDIIALLAMAGALALGQYLAGAVVALMLAGGQALEERAGCTRPAGSCPLCSSAARAPLTGMTATRFTRSASTRCVRAICSW